METNITSANVAMETAKRVLNNVSNDNQNPDYKNIIQLIEKYLIDHCNHNIIDDLIDIDPDRSQMIKYCTICYKTF